MLVDIVVQGNITQETAEIVQLYKTIPGINSIIVSCWDTDVVNIIEDVQVKIVRSCFASVPKTGTCNTNYQIQSSKAGIQASYADIVIKVRSDMQIHPDDIIRLINYYQNNYNITLLRLDGTKPLGKILTPSIFTAYAYHPRDHLFMGFKEDLFKFFDIPFSSTPHTTQYVQSIRSESYLGSYYYSQFIPEVKDHILNTYDCLTDVGARRAEVLKVSHQYMLELFLVCPLIHHIWKKYRINSYRPLHSPGEIEVRGQSW